jgi:hypothetical protein
MANMSFDYFRWSFISSELEVRALALISAKRRDNATYRLSCGANQNDPGPPVRAVNVAFRRAAAHYASERPTGVSGAAGQHGCDGGLEASWTFLHCPSL